MINIFPEEPTAPVFSSSSSSNSKFFLKVVNHMPNYAGCNPEDHRLLKYKISAYIIFTLCFEQMFRCCGCCRLRRRLCVCRCCCCCFCSYLVIGFYVYLEFYNVTTSQGLKNSIGRSRSKGLRRTFLTSSVSFYIYIYCVWCSVNCGI